MSIVICTVNWTRDLQERIDCYIFTELLVKKSCYITWFVPNTTVHHVTDPKSPGEMDDW